MLRCCVCRKLIHIQKVEDADYIALGEPCCSWRCHQDAYALDRFDKDRDEGQLRLQLE